MLCQVQPSRSRSRSVCAALLYIRKEARLPNTADCSVPEDVSACALNYQIWEDV